LFERLGVTRVTIVSAPPGSGKTVLLWSWINRAGAPRDVAWVAAGRGEGDPQRFWLSVLGALRRTAPGSVLVQPLTAAPDLDGWALAERLLADLAPLRDSLWLVIDDVQGLDGDALRQLELLIMRAPPGLRFVLADRHDVRLGLHRLRLEGELTEIREPDLRFTVAEAQELFDVAGVKLPDPTLLVERTEGWAAGLRLAALSLAGHEDPERFAAQFSGGERTVAEYLLAEVLDRQGQEVRRLLLRTAILERVNGELADLLTGGSGGERVLQDLERAGAFTISLDAQRSWFRYHHLFADLLQLQLRRTAPGEVTVLHRAAAGWFARSGYPVEAVRHAQAARDWDLAASLLADNWPALYLDGQAAITHELLAGFPAEACAADARLAAVAAGDELAWGSLEMAERYLGLAERAMASASADRPLPTQLLAGITRLLVARQRGNRPAVAEEAQRLEAMTLDAAQPGMGEDLRVLALISLGITDLWAGRFEDAERHLGQGITLAHRIGRSYLEFTGLAHVALCVIYRSFARAAEYSRQAIELAERHGWTDKPDAGIACAITGFEIAWQGQLEEAEAWVQRAERTLSAETEPAVALGIRYVRGLLDLACGRYAEALAALRAAEPLAGRLVAIAALAPVLDGSAPLVWPAWLVQAFLLEAIARDALGDEDAADRAVERALDQAEPDGALLWFLLYPVPDILERHTRHRTSHAALIAGIQSQLAGRKPALTGPRPLLEPLSNSELRVLRYLPTNLTAPEIARELYISLNTVKSHMRNLYAKLGAHRRIEAVERGRALGLLASSPPSFTGPREPESHHSCGSSSSCRGEKSIS
jgi:LuxR family maltose regulon positive regulatory protein